MTRVYIAGCGGMLGQAFQQEFSDEYDLRCTDIDLNEEWLTYCDVRDGEAYRDDVLSFSPDLLFHIGAHTNLEYCETDPDDTYATNTVAVENALGIARELDIPMLYISTAGIFDGAKEVYDDWDQPNPLGHYARSKYLGELSVVRSGLRYLICRAGWMMGGGPRKDKKFVQKLMSQLRDGAKELCVVNDKDGTPTYTHDFAKNVRALIERKHWGLYNMVCEGLTSRLDVATELLETVGLSKDVAITPVTSEYFKDSYFAERPPSERLLNRKLKLRGYNAMPDWKDALRRYIRDSYDGYLE